MKTTKFLIFRLILATCCSAVILLSGCATYGVDNETWGQLTPSQREIAMRNYYRSQEQQQRQQAEIDKINAQNAPLNDAISAIGDLAGSQSNHKQCVTDDFNNTVCGYNCYVDRFGSGHCANS